MSIGIVKAEIFKDMKQIFKNNTYNEIYAVCILLFGKKAVSYTGNSITVKDKVNIFMNLSHNETNIYIYSYIMPPGFCSDTWYNLSKNNYVFRFFCSEYTINYLQLKHTENEYIKQHEG